jgi:hypothetical protein
VAVTYFEWSASSDQRIIIPWRMIDGPETADALANEIMKRRFAEARARRSQAPSIFAMPLFDEYPNRGLRRVVDFFGDGPNVRTALFGTV